MVLLNGLQPMVPTMEAQLQRRRAAGGSTRRLFFAVVIQSIIVTIAEETPGLDANLWYLDDGTIAGRTSDVYRAYETIEEMGPQRGLQLGHMKCELIRHRPQPLVEKSPVYPFPKTFKRIYTEKAGGWEILGTPIGSKAFCEKFIEENCTGRNIPPEGMLLLRQGRPLAPNSATTQHGDGMREVQHDDSVSIPRHYRNTTLSRRVGTDPTIIETRGARITGPGAILPTSILCLRTIRVLSRGC